MLAAAVLTVASLPNPAVAADTTLVAVNPTDMGWYQDLGNGSAVHYDSNTITLVGQYYDGMYRNWFLFDLSGVDSRFEVAAATLEINWTNSSAPGTFTLHEVATPASVLTANHPHPGSAEAGLVYEDLGSGTVYGSLEIVEPDPVRLPHAAVPLNEAGIAAVDGAINGANGGQLAMGGTYPADTWVPWDIADRSALGVSNLTDVELKLSLGPGDDFFLAPVDNVPFVNVVRAGSAIPVTFSLGGYYGTDIFAAAPSVVPVACEAGLVTDTIETYVTASTNSLTYDPITDQYTFVWKTQKGWTGCRELQLTLLDDSTHVAEFMFK